MTDTSELQARHQREDAEFLRALGVQTWVELPSGGRRRWERLQIRHAEELRVAWGRDPKWGDKTPARLREERLAKAAQ